MQVTMSSFLIEKKPILKELISLLEKEYKYVSILGTDTKGKTYNVLKTGVNLNDSNWGERGFVVRVHNGVNYSELSFNTIDNENIQQLAEKIKEKLNCQLKELHNSSVELNTYPVIEEMEMTQSFYGEVEKLPESKTHKEILEIMAEIKNKALNTSKYLVDFRVALNIVHISKIFLSSKKNLEQSYIWSEGYLIAIARKDNNTRQSFKSFSGLKAIELLDEMEGGIEETILRVESLLDAKEVVPGEYDIICTPEISGLIAHEAFGHGVEMDMFVKKRAKAIEYIDKQVASELVTMYDGAASAKHVSSFLFDDEGVIGTDTVIIKNGVLKQGLSDLLSAMKLGTVPTGNGKRESFERKAYARMTNTFFAPGIDKLQDMIASIKHGYLLDGTMSGMEDPKSWGIQCMVLMGREIIDGKLTNKIVSPVIMTGYVPDLLKSVTMVSEKVELFGSGACGKGYKEFSKVSDGGPYIKVKARLG